eukprot:scaffold135609_cov33-Attheya_sp.AAC.3
MTENSTARRKQSRRKKPKCRMKAANGDMGCTETADTARHEVYLKIQERSSKSGMTENRVECTAFYDDNINTFGARLAYTRTVRP